jgi:phage gp29-like protein
MSLWTPIARRFAAKREQRQMKAALIERMLGTNAFSGYTDSNVEYVNPDLLVAEKGVEIFREMMDRDDMVAASYAYLQMAALSTGWQVEPYSDEESDQETADYVTHALESMQGSVQQVMLNILDAIPMGFVVLEKVWAKPEERGDWAGKQGLARLSHKNPVYIDFNLDEFGRIRKDGIWQETMSGDHNKFTRDDVVYWAYDTKDDNPYGRSPSRRAYRWYFFKDGCVRLWARYVERFGMPILEGTFPKGAGKEDRNTLKTILKEFRSSMTFIKQSDWEIELHNPQSHYSETQLFSKSIQSCNRSISRSIYLPALVMEIGEDATGSYALGQEHNNQFVWILNFVRDGLADVVNEQIVKPLVEHNFPEGTPCPSWQLKPYTEEDLESKAKMMLILAQMGLPISTDYLRDVFSIPQPGEDEEVVSAPSKPEGGYQMPGMDEEEAKEFTEILVEGTHGKLKPEATHVHMGGNGNKRNAQPLSPIERNIRFEDTNIEEDVATAFWSDTAADVLVEIGNDLEATAGKEPGARRNK